jgi:hypothetical protein
VEEYMTIDFSCQSNFEHKICVAVVAEKKLDKEDSLSYICFKQLFETSKNKHETGYDRKRIES